MQIYCKIIFWILMAVNIYSSDFSRGPVALSLCRMSRDLGVSLSYQWYSADRVLAGIQKLKEATYQYNFNCS